MRFYDVLILARSACASLRTNLDVQKRFPLIQELLFDYLIAILAQILLKIDFHQVSLFSNILICDRIAALGP